MISSTLRLAMIKTCLNTFIQIAVFSESASLRIYHEYYKIFGFTLSRVLIGQFLLSLLVAKVNFSPR